MHFYELTMKLPFAEWEYALWKWKRCLSK